jgi:hypothetical protein
LRISQEKFHPVFGGKHFHTATAEEDEDLEEELLEDLEEAFTNQTSKNPLPSKRNTVNTTVNTVTPLSTIYLSTLVTTGYRTKWC